MHVWLVFNIPDYVMFIYAVRIRAGRGAKPCFDSTSGWRHHIDCYSDYFQQWVIICHNLQLTAGCALILQSAVERLLLSVYSLPHTIIMSNNAVQRLLYFQKLKIYLIMT